MWTSNSVPGVSEQTGGLKISADKIKPQPDSEGADDIPAIEWIVAADNPWGVPVLDARPVTLNMVSTSADPQCAENAISFTQDEGCGFIGEAPLMPRRIEASLRFPVDRMLADGADDPAILTLLIARGSPVDVRSDSGTTPLMSAVQSASLAQVGCLLDHRADVNTRDQRGFTALHRAAEMGHLAILQLLLDHGAEPNPIAAGETPLSLAKANDRKDIVAVLERTFKSARLTQSPRCGNLSS